MHEWTNGFRAIQGSFISKILTELNSFNGYVFQIAILDRAIKNHLNIVERPMHFKERKSGISKINAGKYILDILLYILLNSTFLKFCFVGFIGFIINIFGLELFYRIGFTPGVAAAIGAELSIISNFILNNFWSFSHNKIDKNTNIINKFGQFNLVSFGSIVIQFIVVTLGTSFFGDQTRFLFLLTSVIVFIIPYSYFMYNRFIWTNKSS